MGHLPYKAVKEVKEVKEVKGVRRSFYSETVHLILLHHFFHAIRI